MTGFLARRLTRLRQLMAAIRVQEELVRYPTLARSLIIGLQRPF